MKHTNKLNLPTSLCNAVERDDYHPGESDVTVSELTKPVQSAVLSRLHADEIEKDVSELIFALMGKAVHHVLEVSDTELREERLYYNFPIDAGLKTSSNIVLGGKFDRFVLKDGTLQDYKVASVWSRIFESFDDWKKQLNAYAFLLKENGYNVKRIEIVAIYRDWSASKAERGNGYPAHQVELIEFEVAPNDITYSFLRDQVQVFKLGMEDPKTLPPCTDEEMWARPTKYALMKELRKSAVAIRGSLTEIFQHAETIKACKWNENNTDVLPPFYIEVRPGSRPRCEKYCDGAPWCEQWAEFQMVNQGESDE